MTQIRFNATHLLASFVSIVALVLAPTAHAEGLQDISKLVKQGQHARALEQVDKFLATKPKDAQGRFLKGIVLTEMNKPSEAIAVFTKLTEDYPELPEPYNNLAVIYAQQKQYDKAQQALEMAIRTHPSYATAHENLGDIYARLASQAYDKALQLDSSNSSAQNKLALIRDLMSTSGRPGKATKPIGNARPVETVKIAEAPKAAAAPIAAEPAKVVEAPKPAPAQASGDDKAEVAEAVKRWAAAWSSKDMKAYLEAYASDFKTPGGESRSAWSAGRKKRIVKPGSIDVSYDNLRITINGDTATASFRQHYKSSNFKTSGNKVLQMGKRDGKWMIVQERVGN
ncbi:MAG: tetratricopeptide repeat protein [Sulfuritalea sp.]|nr:tetratricopeptide repeat protein [Sulfuritalea sp.]